MCRGFVDNVLNPQHIEDGQTTDGFAIGGISPTKLKKKYAPIEHNNQKASDRRSKMSTANPEAIYGSKKKKEGNDRAVQSFVLNAEMVNIRQAELVILKEEERFGQYSRDLQDRIVPILEVKFLQKRKMKIMQKIMK